VHYLWKGGLAAGLVALALGGAGLLTRLGNDGSASPYAGRWKVTFLNGDKETTVALLDIEDRGGNPRLDVVAALPRIKDAAEDVRGDAKGLHFTLNGRPKFVAAVYPPAGDARPQRLPGSVQIGGTVLPLWLERTDIKKLTPDSAEKSAEGFDDLEKVNSAGDAKEQEKLLQEVLRKHAGKPVALYAAQTLVAGKARAQAPEAEVRAAADRYVEAAAAYGPEMEGYAALQAARGLLGGGLAKPAVGLARRADKLLPADAPPDRVQPLLKVLAAALKADGDADGAAKASARLAELDKKLDEEFEKNAIPFTPEPYRGRKKKTDRVTLVELFTGAHCPPCVAADVAFDAALKTYKPGQVAALQYHLHIPRPDPLTTADSVARSEYYGDAIPGTPTFFVDGKPGLEVGGPAGLAKEGYEALTRAVNDELEEEPGARIKLSAHRNGDAIDLRAEVSGLKNPGPKVRLRFVLAEEVARYAGTNGQRLHHHVVRAFPGGVEGFELKQASATHEASVKVADLIAGQEKYLKAAAKERQFLDDERPLDYRRLRAFAFVQDDATKRVLQAAQVALEGPKEGE
jgi:hypothetical protein